MTNICSCRGRSWSVGRGPSCTPTSTRSTPRSSSVTTRACGAGRSSWARASCWPPATRRRRVGSVLRWGAGRPASSARVRWSWHPGSRPTSTRAGRCSPCSRTRHPSSRASRSTRRSSRSAACGASPGVRRRSRSASGARCASGSACPSPSGWRAPSSWPRSPAESRSRTACWWSRPTARSTSCTRFPSNSSGASARSPRASSTNAGSRRSARSPRSASRCSSGCSDAPQGATCTRSPTTGTRVRCRPGAAGVRSARSARSAATGTRPTPSTRSWSASSTA